MKSIVLIAALAAAPVFAGGSNDHHQQPTGTSVHQEQSQHQSQSQNANTNSKSWSDADSSSRSNSNSKSNATGGDAFATGGNSAAGGGDANATNGNNTVGVDSTYTQVRQTPPAFAGTVQPTASCKNAINGGASAPVAGVSFGFGRSDDECDLRETAREFYEMGEHDLAVTLLCTSKAAKRLAQCKPSVIVESAHPEYATHEEVDRAFRKANQK